MSKKKTEKSLFSSHDYEHNDLPTNKTNEQKQPPIDFNGQMLYGDNYWLNQPPPYWNQSMSYMPYGQYPPISYHHPSYSAAAPNANTSDALPPAPLGITPLELSVGPTVLNSFIAPVPSPNHVRQTSVPGIAPQYIQSPTPYPHAQPPLYYYNPSLYPPMPYPYYGATRLP